MVDSTIDNSLEIKRRVREQFSASATDYVQSRGHATGSDLGRMVEVIAPQASDQLLDIATGGGHVARAFGLLVSSVVIADLTPRMLQEAASFLSGSGLQTIESVAADAELLPFDADALTSLLAGSHRITFPIPNGLSPKSPCADSWRSIRVDR